MTEREHLVGLSAFALSTLVFAASWWLVSRPAPEEATTVASLVSAPVPVEVETPPAVRPTPSRRVAQGSSPARARRAPIVTETPPAAGLTPAPAPRRRVVVVRRSRAS